MNEEFEKLVGSPPARYLSPSEFLSSHPGLLGRGTLYERLRDGSIPCIRVGKRILIPEDALERLLQARPGASR